MADQDFNIKVVTTADTSGIRQTGAALTALQQQQLKQQQEIYQRAYEAGRGLRVIAGAATIGAGYQFVSQLREAATYIEKISQELSKESAQIVENAQKYAELSKFAKDEADVLKIADGALKGVESSQKKMIDAASEQLTIWQKIGDIWAAGFRTEGPIAAALRLKQEQAAQNFETSRQNAILEITAAKLNAARRAGQTYEETIRELNDRIREQQALANTHWEQKDIQSYLAATTAAERYKKELEEVEKARDKAQTQKSEFIKGAVENASPQVQRALQQEDAFRRTGDEAYLRSAEQFKRGMTQGQREEYEGLTKGNNQQAVIDAINDLKRDLIGIWR